MADAGGALVVIALAEGGELRVGADAVTVGERRYELARVQDALQVSPEPETIALRVAGAGLVDFRPARQGDGRVALEAIYRLRPDLRPAGFEPATSWLPGAPPPPPPGAVAFPPPMPGPYGPYGPAYPPPGTPPAAPAAPHYLPSPPYAPYGPYAPPGMPNPNRQGGEVTPYPRRFGELLAAIFALFFKHLPRWIALGLFVGVAPAVVGGAMSLVVEDALPRPLGDVPLATLGPGGTDSCRFPDFVFPTSERVARDVAVLAGLFVLSLALEALRVGALAVAGREALLGRPVPVGPSVAAGLRRLPRVLGPVIVIELLGDVLIRPGILFFLLALPNLSGLDVCDPRAVISDRATAGLLLDTAGVTFVLVGGAVFAILRIRLGLAPYVAATERTRLGPSLRRSWHLTRGAFWRMLGVALAMVIIATLVAAPFGASDAQVASVALLPLASVLTAPLLALTWMTLLYDLRLRREGYAALQHEEGEKPMLEPVARA